MVPPLLFEISTEIFSDFGENGSEFLQAFSDFGENGPEFLQIQSVFYIFSDFLKYPPSALSSSRRHWLS
jgi:hypothetical protein